MRLPPAEILRDEPPADDLLLVVRGGRDGLSDAVLQRTTRNSWTRYEFFGASVFGAPGDDVLALDLAEPAIRRRRSIRTARCDDLRQAGFEVMATFLDPLHFSVILPEATPHSFEQLRRCFSEELENPGYDPDG